jgi:ribulose-phosphate 3-epimerase
MIDGTGRDIALEVDGGIKPGTAGRVARAGADVLVAGSAVFETDDYARAIAALRDDAARAWT